MQEVDNKVWNHKQMYENWLDRLKSFEFEMDEISRECSQHFDNILEKAREINGNLRLNDALRSYDNDPEEGVKNAKNDQQIKNEFYLYLKQEVNNSQVHKRR